MKFLLVVYVISVWAGVGLWAFKHNYDANNDGSFKANWRWIIWFILILGTAPIAKLVGVI